MKHIYSGYVRMSCIVALSASITLSAIAGPGPQYWAQQHATAADAKAQPAMTCPNCADSVVTVLTSGGGKTQARPSIVGQKHTCNACGGEIRSVQGKTTNDMKSACPICAKAEPACCKLSS